VDALLRRYLDGDHERVWKELTPANGLDVARETMSRVRRNVEILEKRLRETGYAFAEDLCPAFAPPPPALADTLRRIEGLFGPLPLALRSFFEAVECVDFRAPDGVYAGEPWSRLDMPDPLVVWPLAESFDSGYGDGESMSDADRAEYGCFTLDFAPDAFHKDNVSGGAPYAIALPCSDVDPPLHEDATGMTFLGHLRLAIRNGGFLRLDAESRLPGITKDLLAF
jgi:hypothetical protein